MSEVNKPIDSLKTELVEGICSLFPTYQTPPGDLKIIPESQK